MKASGHTRCALAGFQDVPSGRPPSASLPAGVEPPEPVRVVLQGLAAIEALDTRHQQAIGAVKAV